MKPTNCPKVSKRAPFGHDERRAREDREGCSDEGAVWVPDALWLQGLSVEADLGRGVHAVHWTPDLVSSPRGD
eukprot:CAMPEP_0180375280 /NCGR_PEP_ID=MMETSP0989-20121125/22573_1 /TAXON_ID=697907 /ORGANISM="non described non described, Strain CCMP2293" /LENGTH=72 /DNA_ID=CAMNT_0022372969 /DNA_START=243 /DNA_END=461 /DNA_ORIENTATION=-